MSATSAPRGLVPVKKLGGQPYTGAFTKYPLPSNYTAAIGNGDLVKLLNTGSGRGQIVRMNATTTATTATSSGIMLGVCVGCSYTDPNTSQPVERNYYPGAIVASDIMIHVVDDPQVLFAIQADEAIAQTKLGCNYAVIQTAVTNTTNGNSGLQVDGSTYEETATLPVRAVEFDTSKGGSIGDAYTDLIVMINPAVHFHNQGTGVDNS